MKITFHVPIYDKESSLLQINHPSEEQVKATVQRLFPDATDLKVTQRATGTLNVNWQDLDSLGDLLGAKIEYSPFVTFTIEEPAAGYSQEQQQFLKQPGIQAHNQIEAQELLDDLD